MKKYILILITIIAFIGISGCFKKDNNENGNIVIKNSGTIEIKNETADIYYEGSSITSNKRGAVGKNTEFSYNITLSAVTAPIVVDGKTVQANDIKIQGNRAYISYNYAGEEFRGAVQILDITNKENPQIIKEIQFKDIDINCVYVQGDTFLFGGMANPDNYTGRTVVGFIDLTKLDNLTDDDITNGMNFFSKSYAVTSIARRGSNYYIGVGAKDGGVIVTDLNLTEVTTGSFITLPDVRDIEEYQNGVITLAGTTDNDSTTGKIVKIADTSIDKEIEIADFNSEYTKATIEVWKGTVALLGLAEGGMAAMDLNTDEIYFTLVNPDDNPLHVTNSVSSDGNLLFTANGEYGFRVLDVDGNKTDSNFATVAGYYPYNGVTNSNGVNYSANHVVYKSGNLLVASGVGGVQIFNLSKK